MEYSISDRSYRNFPFLVVGNDEFPVVSVLICTINQVMMETVKFRFEVILKMIQIVRRLFAFPVPKLAFINIF